MPNGTNIDQISETLSVPLESLIVALGSGIGRGQAEMDRNSIEITQQIAEDPVLAQAGLEATWYQIPSAEMEIKLSIVLEEKGQTAKSTGSIVEGKRHRLWALPMNPRLTNQFGYSLQAASTVKLTIAAVPPPASIGSYQPVKDAEMILAIAKSSLVLNTDGTPKPRVSVNFNAASKAWYVVQTDESTEPPVLLRLLKIDDETGAILKKTMGG